MSSPAILRPRWSSASSTEFFMYSPITPCGPESVVMKPILTFCCAPACPGARNSADATPRPIRNSRFMCGSPPSISVYQGSRDSVQARPAVHYISPRIDEHRTLIRERRLDREAGREDALVLPREPHHHQPDRSGLGGVDGERERAAVEEIDDARVAQHVAVRQAERLRAALQPLDRRSDARHGGHDHRVDVVPRAREPLHEA